MLSQRSNSALHLVPEGHEARFLTESRVQPGDISCDGDDAVVEHGDDDEHQEREAAREGHVQTETRLGAPHADETER